MNTKVSIIIPVYNEEKHIEKCIQSLLQNDYPKEHMEILFVDGMSNDKTREIIALYCKKYSFIRLLDNLKKITPVAMNIGIREAKGEYLIIMGAHSSYPANYVSKLISWMENLRVDLVGANCKIGVVNKNSKTNAIIKVLTNKLGVGNGMFRLGVSQPTKVDTVAFGCYRKETFHKVGLFNEQLVRNQDIELNKRIIKNGGTIYLVPDVDFTYYARETFTEIAKNNYGNGLWNILTVYYTKDFRSLSIRHFIPLTFILSLIIPTLLAFFKYEFIYVSLISFIMYNIAVISQSIKLNDETTNIFNLIQAFYTLHFSYGFGSLVGLFKVLKMKMQNK